jgi:catechol 2,3-dioxygenase-like lactoylglutathione lyase family enzyme
VATRLHHLDLAVRDVQRSLDFYLGVLGPLGARQTFRYPTYRGT